MKKIVAVLASLSLGFAVFMLSACSSKQESVELLEKKCCDKKADLNNTMAFKPHFEPFDAEQMRKIHKERMMKGRKFNLCFEEEIKKAKAEKKEFISVDYLEQKCSKFEKKDETLPKGKK